MSDRERLCQRERETVSDRERERETVSDRERESVREREIYYVWERTSWSSSLAYSPNYIYLLFLPRGKVN